MIPEKKSLPACLWLASPAAVLVTALLAARSYAAQFTNTIAAYTVEYPEGWETQLFAQDGALQLRKFPPGEVHLHGGGIPFGGVEVQINAFPPYPSRWPADNDQYAYLEKLGRKSWHNDVTISSRTSGGPARLDYTARALSGHLEKNVIVVLRQGGRFFEVGLRYQADDPSAATYEQALSDIVTSIAPLPDSVAGGTPTP